MLRENIFLFVAVVTLASGLFVTKDECPPNEEYLLCGSACPFNCSSPKGPVNCSEDCIEGCFCKTGFLRDQNDTCVSQDQCIGETNPVCGANEEFLSCGTACPLTCEQPAPPECGLACSMGCFCKSGYVRDTKNGVCVTLDKCPVEQCLNENEVYDICNAACEPTCSEPQPICAAICAGGCVCAPGFMRDDQGVCVRVEKCPLNNSTDPGLLGKYLSVINKILHLSANVNNVNSEN